MANEFDISVLSDGTVVVVLSPACKIDKEQILALLSQLGFESPKVLFLEPDQVEERADLRGNPVIIPIDEATCDLPELSEAGRICGDAGGRVIVLFGPDSTYDGLHPIADKYGTQCGWSVDELKVRVSGQIEDPCSPSGDAVSWSEGREVKCKKK